MYLDKSWSKQIWKHVNFGKEIKDALTSLILIPSYMFRTSCGSNVCCREMTTNGKQYHYNIQDLGGKDTIGDNFNVNSPAKQTPPFYKNCFKSWSKYLISDPKTVQEILIQPLWNNKKIYILVL